SSDVVVGGAQAAVQLGGRLARQPRALLHEAGGVLRLQLGGAQLRGRLLEPVREGLERGDGAHRAGSPAAPPSASRSRSAAARMPLTKPGASVPQYALAVSTASSIAPSGGIGCSPGTSPGCSISNRPTRRIERSSGAIRSSVQPSAWRAI